MIPVVVAVEHVRDFQIRITFDDGLVGDVDIAELVEFVGVSTQLKDPSYFLLADVDEESGTVVWPGGANLDPVVLYSHVTGIDVMQVLSAEQPLGT